MSVASYCRQPASTVEPDESLRSAAQRMEKEGMGCLVVASGDQPMGVLTDRDLALRVLAEGRDAEATCARDVLRRSVTTIRDTASLADASASMARHGLRRLPVVDEGGALLGVIAADDVLRVVASEVVALAGVASGQVPEGAPAPSAPRPGEVAQRAAGHYHKDVVCLPAEASVKQAAEQMKSEGVGCVVATETGGNAVGLVTDRDLVLRVIAAGLDPESTRVSSVMSTPLVSAEPEQSLEVLLETMRSRGVRRVPILSAGKAVGIVSYDDILVALGRELEQLGGAALRESRREHRQVETERARAAAEERWTELGSRIRERSGDALDTVRQELGSLWERIRKR